jgi:hypothetical protein
MFVGRTKWIAAIVIVGIVAGTLVVFRDPGKRFFYLNSCLAAGGKWASNGNYCIRRSCADDGSCLPSYNNAGVCSTLKTGIAADELYFELGMPLSGNGDTYTFAGGGGSPSPIKATIVNGTVTQLDCGL